MELTKKQAELISSEYNLGKVKSLKPIAGGWVNYNYELKTDKGKFVVRLFGAKRKKDTKNRLFTEFNVLSHLHKIKFPYPIPYPLKNKKGGYLINIKKTSLWVYPYMEGSLIKDYDNAIIKSIARALATYHKYVENIKITNNRKVDSLKETSKKYKEMRKQKSNNSANKLMLENLRFFEESLNKVEKIKFNTKQVPLHYDFHKENLLFDKKQVVGILDFERLLYAPRILDIAHLIKCTYKKDKSGFIKRVNFIIKEYDKVNPLTKKEKDLILPMLARDNCRMFERFYKLIGLKNKKIHQGDLSCLKWTIDVQRLVMGSMG
ncbi:MAG: phosphotransferase [Nanoarchaeota archaeon]|nr:phosphotransferase [Nanoarchaeota archaeon]MBU1445212.1 phosphotransferase [Nanoarchaeota archaeon]MBU2406649.1 phosphotransferase [Nanoarchaeota archaeon]MBU2420447.1 phosphotransferase [Nanoarchaeota archaeon]MBU2475749.1 phosphotransferase [Nanoarchaeota archaeon]